MSSQDIPVIPACGLYKTSAPVPGQEQNAPAGRLVSFHNHSTQGPPVIFLPVHNRHNRWHFSQNGYLVDDLGYLSTLVPLLREGLYRVREHFHPNAEQIVAKNALVQLGYTMSAEPILFFPTADEQANAVQFPDRGMKIGQPIYELLESLDLRGPHRPSTRHLH